MATHRNSDSGNDDDRQRRRNRNTNGNRNRNRNGNGNGDRQKGPGRDTGTSDERAAERTPPRPTEPRPQISEDEPRSAQEERDRYEQDYEV